MTCQTWPSFAWLYCAVSLAVAKAVMKWRRAHSCRTYSGREGRAPLTERAWRGGGGAGAAAGGEGRGVVVGRGRRRGRCVEDLAHIRCFHSGEGGARVVRPVGRAV